MIFSSGVNSAGCGEGVGAAVVIVSFLAGVCARTFADVAQLNPATITITNNNLTNLFDRCEQLFGEFCWNIAVLPLKMQSLAALATANTRPTSVTFRE